MELENLECPFVWKPECNSKRTNASVKQSLEENLKHRPELKTTWRILLAYVHTLDTEYTEAHDQLERMMKDKVGSVENASARDYLHEASILHLKAEF